jgi:hypothetical protein
MTSQANSAQIVVQWQGTIDIVTTRNGNLPFSLPFSYSVGAIVHGTSTYDSDLPGITFSGTHQGYHSENKVIIDEFTFSPTSIANQLWIFDNDVSLNDGLTGFDQFQNFLRDNSFRPGYDVDGGVILRDTTASVFEDLSAPLSLSIGNFQVRHWSLWIHGEGNTELTAPSVEISGTITSIAVVPEPTGFVMAAGGALYMWLFRRNRRQVC